MGQVLDVAKEMANGKELNRFVEVITSKVSCF